MAGIIAQQHGHQALLYPAGFVDPEDNNRGTPFRTFAGKGSIGIDLEMVIPRLPTWVIQLSRVAGGRIERGDIWPFEAVALQARQTEISPCHHGLRA